MVVVYVIIALAALALLTFASFAFLVRPNARRDVSRFRGKEYAHRGLWSRIPEDGRPENSPAAFREAARRGIGVELDIQLTRDKKVVVFHDSGLKRVCKADLKLCELDYAELARYPLPNGETIPLFSDVLEMLDGVPVICEIKTGNGIGDVECCELAKEMILSYKGDICIESFNPVIVKWFRINAPELIRGQLSNPCRKGDGGLGALQAFALGNLLVNLLGRPDFIAYQFTGDTFGFRLCRALWKPFCVAWTARGDKQRADAAARYGTVIYEEQCGD